MSTAHKMAMGLADMLTDPNGIVTVPRLHREKSDTDGMFQGGLEKLWLYVVKKLEGGLSSI